LQGYSTRVPEALEQSSEAQKVCSRGKDTGSEKKIDRGFLFLFGEVCTERDASNCWEEDVLAYISHWPENHAGSITKSGQEIASSNIIMH
jgi:hypothetical protein